MARDATTASDTSQAMPVTTPGVWLEGNIYRLKVEDVRRCRSNGTANDVDAGIMRLGVRVQIASKLDSLIFAPRDLTLESEGVVFQAKLVDKPTVGCAPVLGRNELRRGKSAIGIAVFDVPSNFKFDARGPTLAYQPTRWGGAKRTEVRLPACFPDCGTSEMPRGKRR